MYAAEKLKSEIAREAIEKYPIQQDRLSGDATLMARDGAKAC